MIICWIHYRFIKTKLSCTNSANVLPRAKTNIDTCYNKVILHRNIFSCHEPVWNDNTERRQVIHTKTLHTNYRSEENVFQQTTMFSILMRYCCPIFFLPYLLRLAAPCIFPHTKTLCLMQNNEHDVNPYLLHSHNTCTIPDYVKGDILLHMLQQEHGTYQECR